ncbi:hypothetical protein [Spirosoma fluminis]
MYFSEPVIFEVPVLPRIKKFIDVKLQDAQGRPQPMLISPQCEGAGLFMWAMAQSRKVMMQIGSHVRRQESGTRSGGGRILTPEDFTETLVVGICEFHQSRHQYLYNVAELNSICSFIDYIILNEMVNTCQQAPIDPMRSIKVFTDTYDFSMEDLTEDSLKQTYLRARKGVSAFNFHPKLVHQNHFMAVGAMAA